MEKKTEKTPKKNSKGLLIALIFSLVVVVLLGLRVLAGHFAGHLSWKQDLYMGISPYRDQPENRVNSYQPEVSGLDGFWNMLAGVEVNEIEKDHLRGSVGTASLRYIIELGRDAQLQNEIVVDEPGTFCVKLSAPEKSEIWDVWVNYPQNGKWDVAVNKTAGENADINISGVKVDNSKKGVRVAADETTKRLIFSASSGYEKAAAQAEALVAELYPSIEEANKTGNIEPQFDVIRSDEKLLIVTIFVPNVADNNVAAKQLWVYTDGLQHQGAFISEVDELEVIFPDELRKSLYGE